MAKERRKHQRLTLRHEATITFIDGSVHRCRLVNISFGGCFVECASLADSQRRDQCFLSLLLAGDKPLPIRINSRIVRSSESGVGLSFLSIDLADYHHFRNMMVANAPDPEGLIEELDKYPGLEICDS